MVLHIMVPRNDFPRMYRLNKLKPLLRQMAFFSQAILSLIKDEDSSNHVT